MIYHFFLLKAPFRSSKRCENSTASVKIKILLITPAKMSLPGKYCRSRPWQVQQPGEVASLQKLNSPASVTAKEALSCRQDYRCSFKSDPRSVVRPGEANHPRPNTKLLLSTIIKASPAVNLKIKKIYEDVILKKNKPPAEHQGHIIY